MKDFDRCISECNRAIELGRENYNDYKLIAKAMERSGNAYYKKGDLDQAIAMYENAQMEIHSDATTHEVEKVGEGAKKKERPRRTLIQKRRLQPKGGERAVQSQGFQGAIEKYTEAIKRDPSNPAYWCNRCAAHQKTLNMGDAVKDANEAIKRDPTYIKAYSRRATCEYFTKEYHKALATYQKILDIDENNEEAKKGLHRVARIIEGNMQSGKVDPEQRASRPQDQGDP